MTEFDLISLVSTGNGGRSEISKSNIAGITAEVSEVPTLFPQHSKV